LVARQDTAVAAFFETAKGLGLREQCHWEMTPVDAIVLCAVADAYLIPSRTRGARLRHTPGRATQRLVWQFL